MAQGTHTIVGVHITDRLKEAVEVQQHLTAHGKQIKTRLGLHELDEHQLNGLLILEMVPPEEGIEKLIAELNALEGVEAQKMTFTHPAP